MQLARIFFYMKIYLFIYLLCSWTYRENGSHHVHYVFLFSVVFLSNKLKNFCRESPKLFENHTADFLQEDF